MRKASKLALIVFAAAFAVAGDAIEEAADDVEEKLTDD
jgi:hypothetical protein